MNLRTLLALLTLLLSQAGIAQPYIIKGTVSDTVNSNGLQDASVTLVNAKDSILETYTRADEQGNFRLVPSVKGKYILMITFPGFGDYIDVISMNMDSLDMGIIPLTSRTHLLKEFVFTEQFAAIKVKGDTTEYVADSFKTRDNATVESLLKKLPGIQVNKDGQIIAQGETVEKILVDGEEFFSDDPAVVTKSLQANAVDKVQVFDKKSDQAAFTGIDDGEKTKTINLQLKENKKKGYFGKVNAGAGPGKEQNYFENTGMINAFKGKRKLSAFAIAANTGKVGLGWEDQDKYGGGNGHTEVSDDGGMITYYGNDDDEMFNSWTGQYNGEGLPKAWTGGLHYSNKWNEDKHHLGGNYRYGKQNIELAGGVLTQYALPGDSQYFNRQYKDVFTSGQRNRADALYEWKIDSTSTLKVTANANRANTESNSKYVTESYTELTDGNKNTMNVNTRSLSSDATSTGVNSSIDYRKKFKKKGRSLSLNLSQGYKDAESDGYLKSVNTAGNGDVDQHKENESTAFTLSGKASYTEPLSKVTFLEMNYNLKVDNREAERRTWDKTDPGADTYDTLNSLLSSHYAYDILINTGGANLRFVYEKINFSIGGAISNARFNQHDLFRDTFYRYNYVNFFPRANFVYKLSKMTSFRASYGGNTQQPTLEQVQPLADNTDPLNIVVGNPDLTQEFNHNINLSFNDYKALTGRYAWLSTGFSIEDNAISRTERVDEIGRRIYQFTNIDGNYSVWGYAGYGFKIKKLRLQMSVRGNTNINHVNNIVNGVKSTNDFNNYTFGLSFNYETEDEKFSASLSPGVTYNDNRSSINTQNTNYWTSNNELDLSYELPHKFEVGSTVEWYLRQQTSVFDRNNNVVRWNAYVSKKFLKNDQLELRASAFDILNQNIGFSRVAQNNYITESNYNTIRRYGLISLTWNFTKSAMGAPQQDGGDIIIQK